MMEWAITSSVLIIIVIALRFLFRGKISRRLQYALWGLVLLRLLMPFSLFGSPVSVMNAVPDSRAGERPLYVLPVSRKPVEEASGVTVDSAGTVVDTNSSGYAVLSEDGGHITRYAGKITVGRILAIVWISGGMAAGLWLLGTNLLFYRKIRKSRKALSIPGCDLPVYVTGDIASPCLFGVIHPAIYLTPKAADNEENTHHVLAHERCHRRHGDHIWPLLRGLCLALWWWNPLVWAAAVLSRTDGELACDEAVLKRIGEKGRLSYGRTLVDMIAVKKAPAGLWCAATTMVSGKRGIKERLTMIIKNPKTVISAAVMVLLVAAVCVGCTFTGADKGAHEPPFPEVETVFSSDSTDLTQIGWDAARFYYGQFMTEDTPQYWHITKHAVLSCELVAGDEREFVVSVTSFIETDGAGFLVGQGIPNEDDINKGGDCPDVQRQIRIKALGDGRYEIVGIGTGGYTQGLKLKVNLASCELVQIKNGEVLRTMALPEDGIRLAEDAIATYFLQSDVRPLMDMETLDACYLLRATIENGTVVDYYLYMRDGDAFMQEQTQGYGSRIDVELYLKIEKLAPREAAGDGAHADAATVDRTDLDACVSDAVISHNIGQYPGGDLAAEAHTVLLIETPENTRIWRERNEDTGGSIIFKIVEDGDETTVYIMVLYQEFSFAGGGLTEGGGCHGPVAITFEQNDAGEYTLKEYWEPQDGGGYASSIQEKFPAGIYRDALDTQQYIVGHMQSCYAQAVAYGHVDTDAMIAGLLEIIASSPKHVSNPQAYIDAHEAEYRQLVYLGKDTLRYDAALYGQGERTTLEGHILASACRDILSADASAGFETSDGRVHRVTEWEDVYDSTIRWTYERK